MNIDSSNVKSSLYVSKSVIERVVTDAVAQTDGACSIAKPDKKRLFSSSNGIKTELDGDVIYLTISVKLDADAPAIPTAEKIQSAVKSAVQNTLGLTVARVDVNIADVNV